jgi:hypothetical protein
MSFHRLRRGRPWEKPPAVPTHKSVAKMAYVTLGGRGGALYAYDMREGRPQTLPA